MTEATSQSEKKAPSALTRIAIDFGPLIAFFLSFKFGGIYTATATFMVASAIAMVVSRVLTGHVATTLKFTFVVVMVMGGLTLWLKDETFVKMKLTVINTIFALILFFGLKTGRLYIKMLMGTAMEMEEAGWRLLTRNYAIFLAVMAGVNELIWRTQSTDLWVDFKTFGYMGIMIIFLFAQAPVLAKYMPQEEKSDKDEG
ncbi:septation protein IspZ [Kordiimonas sp. A6E486]|nr:septation protein IspZ [Kordiimonas marina]